MQFHYTVSAAIRSAAVICGLVISLASSLLAQNQTPASDGNNSPSLNNIKQIDLSHWKLTLPVDHNHSFHGHPQEVSAKKLGRGFQSKFFTVDAQGNLVFWCPVNGATTEGTSYPRSELREMLEPGNPDRNWTAAGSHILTARCQVQQVPSSRKVIIGQIHSASGKKKPLIKLQFYKNRIEALVKHSPTQGKDIKLSWPNISMNSEVNYEIRLQNEILSVTVNGMTQRQNIKNNDPEWMKQTFYFKAGMYPQDNQGKATEGGQVSFSKLQVTHQ
ncbi:MAG: polysaccharide lyase family 7 protein [Fuerstiella sp.]